MRFKNKQSILSNNSLLFILEEKNSVPQLILGVSFHFVLNIWTLMLRVKSCCLDREKYEGSFLDTFLRTRALITFRGLCSKRRKLLRKKLGRF